MKPTPSPQDQEQDQEILKILKNLGSLTAEYPPELFADRRAAFVAQVMQQREIRVKEELSSNEQFFQSLEDLKSAQAEYPQELLSARRAAFIAQVEQRSRVEVVEVREELSSKDQEILTLLKRIKFAEAEYPSNLLAARRSAFMRQVARGGQISLLEALRSSIQSMFQYKIKLPTMPTMNMMRTSLVVAALIMTAFIGSLLGNREQLLKPSPSQAEVAQPDSVLATSTQELAKTICKPGYLPPLCLAKEFDKSRDLTFQGNGSARPAVAKDTLPGYSGVHKAAYVNDGLYGPGASWISNSANSWIKIDLGKNTTINTVAFGRDRLGNFNDRDPGQFVIAVALSDNIYADGNSSNDYVEYAQVYNSDQTGFKGVVSGPETVKAYFGSVVARYVKITFANAGTAIDEVEVFMAPSPALVDKPTKKPGDDSPGEVSTLIPTSTSRPADTLTPIPTETPLPADTQTPIPTDTPQPTDTPVPLPTDTPQPVDTSTPVPTDIPPVTATDLPLPVDTLSAAAVSTDVSTDTPLPVNTP